MVDDATEGVTSLDCSVSRGLGCPIRFETDEPCSQNDSWAAASNDSQVRKYGLATDNFEGLITRTMGVPVRSVAFSPNGQKIAIASE